MVTYEFGMDGIRAIVGAVSRQSPSSPVEARVATWVQAVGLLQPRDGEEAEIAVVRL